MSEREISFAGLERTLRTPDKKINDKIKNDPVGLFLEQLAESSPKFSSLESSSADFSYLSPEQRAESLWAVFQNVKGIVSGRKVKEKGARRTIKLIWLVFKGYVLDTNRLKMMIQDKYQIRLAV